jgi:DNA helicase-2/ATP-dependent DNA helicase PcrA
MEEGLFPHKRSVEETGHLEEERRLCYVGITRAREQLYLTHAETRRMFGSENYCRPSRFISEIPAELLEEIRPRLHTRRPYTPARPSILTSDLPWQLGDTVRHVKFGEGIVVQCEGSGEHARVQVNFSHAGSKWLVLAYARLEKA